MRVFVQSLTVPAPTVYELAEAFEHFLGDPTNAEEVFSFKRAVELDELEEYPSEACDLLDEWGLNDYYVPRECGGRLESYEELLALVRAVARRDLTVAVAHVKTYLGAVSVWLGGSVEQKDRLAARIKRREQVALALTEKGHGSDILSSEVEAVPRGRDGYLLSGEKWLINNATRSTALTVFARTAMKGNARGFSCFLVEKEQLRTASYSHLPRVKTQGVRGADISGIRFDQAAVPARALIGRPGLGLELVLKGFQITRCIVPALSLGAADTALRTTVSFAVARKLYGASIFTIPHTRQTLVDAFVDLLICDCQVVAAARALHVLPEQMTLFSAIVKYYVPTTVEKVLRSLAMVLGARYYLREVHWWGIFQKLVRDNALASLFDGSTAVNLHNIALHLRQQSSRGHETSNGAGRELFNLQCRLPPFSPEKFELTNRGRNDILGGLLSTRALITDPEISSLIDDLLAEGEHFNQHLRELLANENAAFDKRAESFELAKRYCVFHAAAICVQIWLHNRKFLGDFFAEGRWLVLALDRLLTNFQPERLLRSKPYLADVAEQLIELYESNRSFSIVPIQLAQTRA
jgi:alkylation response protein AidB-like acyl-CoA dehydrogenase